MAGPNTARFIPLVILTLMVGCGSTPSEEVIVYISVDEVLHVPSLSGLSRRRVSWFAWCPTQRRQKARGWSIAWSPRGSARALTCFGAVIRCVPRC